MPKDDDNDTTCTVNALSTRKKRGVRQKIEESNENPRFAIFLSLSLILPYVVLADLKRWVLILLGNDLSFRIQFVPPKFPTGIVFQIRGLV
jgi:hypothetical protein